MLIEKHYILSIIDRFVNAAFYFDLSSNLLAVHLPQLCTYLLTSFSSCSSGFIPCFYSYLPDQKIHFIIYKLDEHVVLNATNI